MFLWGCRLTKKVGFTHDNKDNKSVDWYTPKWIFDELGLEFDLDPAAPKGGVPWIPAKKHYSKEENGLIQPWEGRVWLNPPYGKYTGAWLEKMHHHRAGVALVFARTDCKWFHKYVVKADAILFLKGRVKFVDGLGKTGGSGAGSGSMLVAWGWRSVEALERMRDKGYGYLVK
jgi:phage N-6-adenine-methyltransferase